MVVLWLLSEGPLHGYRIRTILEDKGLSFWFRTDPGSIYTVLRTLAKSGYIEPAAAEREGLRPERTPYRITRAGRQHFAELLVESWRRPADTADSLQLALAARSELPEGQVQLLLRERVGALEARLRELESLARSAPAAEMVERQVALTRAELEWAESQL